MTARTLAAAALVAVLGTALAQQPKAGAEPIPVALQPKVAEKPDLPKLLATRVTTKSFDGKFKDAVKLLSETYDLPLVVDPRLGENEGMALCDGAIDDKPVKLPKLANARLDTVLKILADQVNGKVLVYPDYIKIVPDVFAVYETGVLTVNTDQNMMDDAPLITQADLIRNKPLTKRGLVTASFKNKPLTEVIDEIAEATGANVAVSPLLPMAVRQAPVTVRFANTPVDAAVRTLCEMTESGVIEDANVLLVTTRERAAVRAKEEAQKLKDRTPPPQQFVVGTGLHPQLDLVAEVAKLKEQNEQLRKDLDEMKKALKK